MRACGLTAYDLSHIACALKDNDLELNVNRNLKVLDLSYNNFEGASLLEFVPVFEQNRTLEFVGLAKNNLTSNDLLPIFDCFGRVPLPAD